MLYQLIVLCVLLVAAATARDGFTIGPNGDRSPLSPKLHANLPRFKESRSRLRGADNIKRIKSDKEPAYKIARELGIDNLKDND
jgi:hypothetical protein